ncbi:MAG TPA: sulfotransferase, partial [Sphingomicrobium sp.]|nr:sulfotransferase [Sphingomicrobium sp.]
MTSPGLAQAVEAFQRGDLDQARSLAEQGLAASPSPPLEHLLGLIHCRQGDPARGVEHLRAAAEAEPGNAGFQVMLIRALVDCGHAEEVLAMPEPPSLSTPAGLALWQARAEAADSAGKSDLAADAWFKVAEARPGDWRALGHLGNALGNLNRWPEAAEALAEAARLNPGDPAVRAGAVSALLRAGLLHNALARYEEAEQAFRLAYSLDPANRAAIHHLGAALERTNRLGELAKLLDEAMAIGLAGDEFAFLFALRAWREGRVEEARELLSKADRDDDPVAWNALMVRIADRLGDFATAFEAAEAMNRAVIERAVPSEMREEWKRRAIAYRQEQHDLARMITPEWAARVPLLDEPSTGRIAFLVGFPRSGTTLLDTFLLGHPDITVLEEEQLVGKAAQGLKIKDLASATKSWVMGARARYLESLERLVDPGFHGVVVDKFPLDMAAAPLIEAMFPGAPIIFAQRHPCDVVLSGFMQSFGMVNFGDVRDAADYYDAMMKIWTASREAMKLNVHTVVYEDLVRSPETVLRPVVEFLGLEWADSVLDHQKTASKRGTIVTPSYDQVTEPVTTKPAGRWKRYRKQLEPVLPILLPWAEKLGY